MRVFITHGGLMGTQEAIARGVPMLGIPLFSDQAMNIENYVQKGIAVKLDYSDITKESLLTAIYTILNNSRYDNFVLSHILLLLTAISTILNNSKYDNFVLSHV